MSKSIDNAQVYYTVDISNPQTHCLQISCTIEQPNPKGQQLAMASWVPGSYKIRDFAKNIVTITAESAGKELQIFKLNKNTWQVEQTLTPLVIKYTVYCFDQQPRGAYVDTRRVFFDSCYVFFDILGKSGPYLVEIKKPKNYPDWQLATTLPLCKKTKDSFGVYLAENYLDLIDQPVQCGQLKVLEFKVEKTKHEIIIDWSQDIKADFARLTADVKQLCENYCKLFGGLPEMEKYLFFVNMQPQGYGGIEHKNSSSLVCDYQDLPVIGNAEISENYQTLLGLFSHEYLHLWNVKRIKPEIFIEPNLNHEVYTKQLWIFEGITSYYDDFSLLQVNLITLEQYLAILAKSINRIINNPGTQVQTVEDASYDAWIKFYQQDENAPNALVSYYTKGSLIALCLDLLIIKDTKTKQSLANVMRFVWEDYGKNNNGLAEQEFEKIVYEVIGINYAKFFKSALRTTDNLPLATLLKEFGIKLEPVDNDIVAAMGANLYVNSKNNMVKIKNVLTASPLEEAGLSANDEIIAANNIRLTSKDDLAKFFLRYQEKDIIQLQIFRGGILLTLDLVIPSKDKLQENCVCKLSIMSELTANQQELQQAWLKGLPAVKER